MQVLDLDLDVDLEAFSAFLWQQGVRHHVFESGGRQIVEVANPEQADIVRQTYDDLQSGALRLRMERVRGPAFNVAKLLTLPVVSAISLACLLLFPASMGWWSSAASVVGALMIAPLSSEGTLLAGALYPLASGEVWRLFTPALLHFSWFHIAFNLVLYIFIGRRIESLQGSWRLLGVVLVTAAISALSQGLWAPGSPFGGLSGVCYGVVGYAFAGARLRPDMAWALPPGLLPFLLVSLVVFSTGISEAFGVYVANAAHWGGLVAGACVGWLLMRR